MAVVSWRARWGDETWSWPVPAPDGAEYDVATGTVTVDASDPDSVFQWLLNTRYDGRWPDEYDQRTTGTVPVPDRVY